MSIRTGSALLFLLCACATTEPRPSKPKQYRQTVLPWVEPLVEPMPLAPGAPVPVGLSPPVTVMVDELRRESAIAAACGYGFVVGVSSAAHKAALEAAEPTSRLCFGRVKRAFMPFWMSRASHR